MIFDVFEINFTKFKLNFSLLAKKEKDIQYKILAEHAVSNKTVHSTKNNPCSLLCEKK